MYYRTSQAGQRAVFVANSSLGLGLSVSLNVTILRERQKYMEDRDTLTSTLKEWIFRY